MPAITKKESRLRLEFVENKDHSIHSGLVAVEAMAQRFGLWQRIRKLSSLDPRRDKRRGYSPEVIVGQLIYALCTGGGCLSDSEALNEDPLAGKLFGVERFADQSQVGEWLRGQSEQSVEDLRQLLREFVAWTWKEADPRRLLHCGQREVFFDDTQLELSGKQFEGAAINYNGDLALSWQTLWVGPFLADSHIGGPKDVSDQLPSMLDRNRDLWRGEAAHFYADSGSSAGVYLDAIHAEGWNYSVSYNRWTSPLERKARELPASEWVHSGTESHALFRHQPDGRKEPQLYAVTRWKADLFEQFGFIACHDGVSDAQKLTQRHHLKGEKEQLFSEVLGGLDLHRPPCSALIANQVYYLIGALAYDLMTAIKLKEAHANNDKISAVRIAKAYLAGTTKSVWVPDETTQKRRDWYHAHRKAVELVTALNNSLLSYLSDNGVRPDKSHSVLKQTRAKTMKWLRSARSWSVSQWQVIEIRLKDLYHAMESRRLWESLLAQEVAQDPLLLSLVRQTGVRDVVAFALGAVIGDVKRFAKPKNLVSYVGLNPAFDASGNERWEGGVGGRGHRGLRNLLIESAHSVLRSREHPLGIRGRKLLARKGELKLVVAAVARWLLVSIWYQMMGLAEPVVEISKSLDQKLGVILSRIGKEGLAKLNITRKELREQMHQRLKTGRVYLLKPKGRPPETPPAQDPAQELQAELDRVVPA